MGGVADRRQLFVRGRGAGVRVQRHLDRGGPEPRELLDGRRGVVGALDLASGSRRRHESWVGYPPGPVSIGPAALINGPSKDGISDASASEKMRSTGHARSRTAVTPPASTAAGSESSMWT